ncbi:MAG: VOC family protein [Chloroflexota bacterium]|nr:VOC family protein [Chloroflexota bacterium]
MEYQRENPLFAFLSYQGSHLMIQELDPHEDEAFITGSFEYPFGRGINFQIDTDNVQKLYDSLKEHNYPLRRDIKDSWYKVGSVLRGCRQILVQDPDGYLLRFSQDIGEKSANQ